MNVKKKSIRYKWKCAVVYILCVCIFLLIKEIESRKRNRKFWNEKGTKWYICTHKHTNSHNNKTNNNSIFFSYFSIPFFTNKIISAYSCASSQSPSSSSSPSFSFVFYFQLLSILDLHFAKIFGHFLRDFELISHMCVCVCICLLILFLHSFYVSITFLCFFFSYIFPLVNHLYPIGWLFIQNNMLYNMMTPNVRMP